MSYEIVKSIKEKDNKVYVKCDSNNVFPKHYAYHESSTLTKTLNEKGREAYEIEVLKAYEEGNFQAGNENKYTRALKILRHLPEYEKFNWRCSLEEDRTELRKSKEFNNLLKKALEAKLPKTKYFIIKEAMEGIAYFYQRKNAGFCKWYYDKERAKRFDYEKDAERTKKWFENSDKWQIVKA